MNIDRETTRRRFLRDAAITGAAVGGAAVADTPLARAARRASSRAGTAGKSVAIFGAGVAGLTAAHELAERGFSVTVYETSHLGGKAWSCPVPGSASGGRPPLPGEHGFRFFPGFYLNLGDTMRRIPTREGTVYDRLDHATTYRMVFPSSRPDLTLPLTTINPPPTGLTPDDFKQSLLAALVEVLKVPAPDAMYWVDKAWVYVSSCDARRLGQWDNVAWSDFVDESKFNVEYREVLNDGLVRNLAATQSADASTHAIGLVGEASILSLMGLGNDQNATFDRVLDGPTSQVWLDQWVALLQSMGVQFNVGWALDGLAMNGGQISGAQVLDPNGQSHTVQAAWYVSAIPFERIGALLTSEMLSADPSLEGILKLQNAWMSGLQVYLREPFPLTNGHVNYLYSPWALTSISQGQFWTEPLTDYGDGTVKESFSTIISDWNAPGILYGKPANELSADQIADEVWAQIKQHVNKDGQAPVLTDAMLHSWFLDPAITPASGGQAAEDSLPLFIQNPGEWANRPDSVSKIPNFFLAGEWVKTNICVTTMDGANQGGRQAANGVLAASGSSATAAELWPLYVPPEFEPFRDIDAELYALGQPNMFDPDRAAPGSTG
jgi:uncharacterized protein with NAD-binding domain and iron-sulfur cluster